MITKALTMWEQLIHWKSTIMKWLLQLQQALTVMYIVCTFNHVTLPEGCMPTTKRMHKQKYQKDLPSELHNETILKIPLKLDGFLRRQFQNNDPAMFKLPILQ